MSRRRKARRASLRAARRQSRTRSSMPAYGWWAIAALALALVVAVVRITQ